MATVESGRLTGRRASDWGTISTRLIVRGQLLAALDRAVTHKVTVISAPAGSGKTSLLRAWADRPRQTHRVAFVTVCRDQRDEQLFWLALLRAIRETVDERDTDEPLIATPGFNAEAMVDRMLAYLADYPGRLVLVLDDLHELDSAGVQTYLTRLLTELPAQVHAVLGTRRDLRLRLHQLRLAGDLAEIRAADLHFTEAETREVLAASGVVVSNPALATLHKRTEGWAAGIRLAAISLAEHPDAERFVGRLARRTASARDRPRRAPHRHSRRVARSIDRKGSASVATRAGAHSDRAPRAAVSADEHVPNGDRPRALPFREHSQHARPQYLREA